MNPNQPQKAFRVPADVAAIMDKWGGTQIKLAAARGALPMSAAHLLTVLYIFIQGDDEQLKQEAENTISELAPGILRAACSRADIQPEIIDMVARKRYRQIEVMEPLLTNPRIALTTLLFVASNATGDVLDLLANNDTALLKSNQLRQLIIQNPATEITTKLRLGWQPEEKETQSAPESATATPPEREQTSEDAQDEEEEEDEEAQTKYQKLLDMPVAAKIKTALTGDKEWRELLLRESNKLVCTAVLKNPRITEGEVLKVAKNRTSSDELIRIITLNRDWVKNYDMKKALIEHPRTPLQNAMRYMTFLTEKDLRELAKSRNVSQVIVNNARRMLLSKKR